MRAVLLKQKLDLPPGFTYKWSGEYQFELRAKKRLQLTPPIVLFFIFLPLYVVFHSVTEAAVLIFPTIYALTGGLILQKLLGYNFSGAVWVGYFALFGIAVETDVVMVVYLHESLNHRLARGVPLKYEDIEVAVIEWAVQRLRPKFMTVTVFLASLTPILRETGVDSDVIKPIAAPMRATSTLVSTTARGFRFPAFCSNSDLWRTSLFTIAANRPQDFFFGNLSDVFCRLG